MTKGERIRQLRESLNIGLTELASKIGVSKQTLYKYENNIVTNIPSDKIEALAKALHVQPSYIMDWEDKPAASSAAVPDLRAYSEKEKKFIDVYLGLSQEDKDFLEKMMFRMAPDAKNDSGD